MLSDIPDDVSEIDEKMRVVIREVLIMISFANNRDSCSYQ
jgi:hypothetical protein